MKPIQAYQTEDGTLFSSEHSAKLHESNCSKSIATTKLHQLLADEFPVNCALTISSVADFIINERWSINLILKKLEENILVEDEE